MHPTVSDPLSDEVQILTQGKSPLLGHSDLRCAVKLNDGCKLKMLPYTKLQDAFFVTNNIKDTGSCGNDRA